MDLNLLVALDALLERNSVQHAAERLHLTPPAMSRTLARIRLATGDQILVRAGRVMVPTERALAIRDETRELVRQARTLLSPHQPFDPATTEAVVTLRGHDVLLGALAAPLLTRLATEAPGLRFRFLPESADSAAELAAGEIDLELGADAPIRPDLLHRQVGADALVAALHRSHPLASRATLTLAAFAGADHVAVSRRGRLDGRLDALLREHGRERRVLATVPTAAAALDLVARIPAVAVVTGGLNAAAATANDLALRPLPLDIEPVPIVLTWHRRTDGDPAHRWVRARVAELLADLARAA